MSEPTPYSFRKPGGLGIAVCVLIGMVVFGNIAATVVDGGATVLVPHWNNPAADDDSPATVIASLLLMAIGVGTVFIFVPTVICFCIWMYRASANIRALGETEAVIKPGWAVGWWFIPVANLWKPLSAMREIYNSSAVRGGAGYRPIKQMPLILGVWWATFLLNGILVRIENRLVMRGTTEEQLTIAVGIGAIAAMFAIVAGVAVIQVILRVDKWQRNAAESQPLSYQKHPYGPGAWAQPPVH